MYNKKCKSTFLFVLALVSLLTLIIPFINVGYTINTSLVLKIFYYIFIVIFCICLILNIVVGIYSLFKNNFTWLLFQELSSYIAFIMLFINLLIFAPFTNSGLTLGYSILCVETFVMAFLSDIIKIFRKTPRKLNNLKATIKQKQAENQKRKEELLLLENAKLEAKVSENNNLETISSTTNTEINTTQNVDEVEIIPPDDELI